MANKRFKEGLSLMPEIGAKDRPMQVNHLVSLLQKFWGANLGGWTNKYWGAMNAYNSAYSGVSVEDFFDCWIHFDILAFDIFEHELSKPITVSANSTPGGSVEYTYNYADNQWKRADNFKVIESDITVDLRNNWLSRDQA